MRTRRSVVAVVAILVLATGALASAAEEAEQAEPTTFTLGQPVERSFAGWTEVARGHGSGMPERFGVMGDRLVGIGGAMVVGEDRDSDDGRLWDWADRAWYSDDGLTWTTTRLPGATPQVTDLAVRPDGSMAIAVGYGQEEWQGAVWVTTDGIEWKAVTPPSRREVDWVAASDEVVVVSAGYRLWTTTDLESWTRVKGPRPVGVAHGPGGFLSVEGGGQDLISKTAVWHSADGTDWSKVTLPKALRNASVGVSAFPLETEWVLVPDQPGLMYTSPDGQRWRKAPRPPGMEVGYVWWMADVGDRVQASGWVPGRKKQPNGLWTFKPGKRVAKPKVPPKGFVESHVVWNDEHVGYGSVDRGDDPEMVTLAMWRRQETEPEQAFDVPTPSTEIPAGE